MITINLDKARTIAHEMRRAARAEAFVPLDAIIAKRIPGSDTRKAEAARKAIREADAARQSAIDAAEDVETLAALLPGR